MRITRDWQGVRMRQVAAGCDPDAPARLVIIPAAWDEGAGPALACLAPGSGPADLRRASRDWIARIEAASPGAAIGDGIGHRLQRLLLLRRGAPGEMLWRQTAGADARPSFILNLPAFMDPAAGFDADAFGDAVETGVTALTLAAPDARRIAVGVADLAGLLAHLGLDYDSDEARAVGAGIAALLRARADAASAACANRLGGACDPGDEPAVPAGLPAWLAPHVAKAQVAAQGAGPGTFRPRHLATTGISRPGPVEALLGAETGGIAPAFALVSPSGGLTRAARALLAARGLSPDAALAAVLAGDTPLPLAGRAAHAAMHEAVAPYIYALPPRPLTLETVPPARAERRQLPARHAGYTQRATVGGHKLFLRTGEYADGRLGEISVALPKDGAIARGLMDGLSHAVSLGLQHGVPLEDFVEAFAMSRFGPAGAVEGDPAVTHATSLLDYVARTLAATYLGRDDLPAAGPEDAAPAPATGRAPELPLGLPADASPRNRRRALRLVER